MDDPFFAPVGTVCIPVQATKRLEREEVVKPVKPAKPPPERQARPCENKRMPSMLNDIVAPKPLKIYANKPPTSRKLFIEMPDTWKSPEPYDDD